MLENLYSGTLKRFATTFPNVYEMSPEVTSSVAHKTFKRPAW